jgi:two-component system sensor histidine kinase KdpD
MPPHAGHRLPQRQSAVVYVPIASAHHVVAVMRVARPVDGRRFTTAERRLLETFANQAALALERARLTEEATRAAVLARSDELKSALLSAVSHDLRTPLASIKASATSLLQEDVEWTPEDRRDLLQAIDEETDRLARIVSNLLDLSRIEAGALRPQRDWNEAEEVIRDTIRRAQLAWDDHPITVKVEPDLPSLLFDYVEIAQVLMNLIENAIKYAPRETTIEVSAWRDEASVAFAVADRGPGIPPDQTARIFDRFHRVEQRNRPGGLGIGLSICKGLVEAHGGRIWFEARAGGGARFVFTLPVEEQRESVVEAPSATRDA